MGLALLYAYRSQTPSVQTVGLSAAIQDVQAGRVKSVIITGNSATIELTSGSREQTTIQEPDEIFAKTVLDYNATNPAQRVDLKYEKDSQTLSAVGSIVLSLLPVLLIGGFFFYMMRQAQGTNNQALSFGKSRARMFIGNKPTVTFDDVAGVDEAKQELTEVVEFLKYPEKFSTLGARIPRGVLLVGPPGTGKTMLARAVAGEAGVPFFSISGSEFVEMFVGVGASRVRDLFDQAKRNAPCIAARRNRKVITQIDFEEALEKVSLGPERRSRVISEKEKNIVAYHEAGHALCFKLLTNTNPVHKISVVSRGMAMGVTWSLPQEDRYFRTKREFEDDIAAALGGWTAEQLHLGGDVTTGASNDIEKATEMARQMVTKYGMSEKLGPLQYGKTDELIFLGRQIQEEKNYSEETSKLIDSEVHEIVDRARRRAYELLTQYRSLLDVVVARLIEQETLSSDEFNNLVDGHLGQLPVAASTAGGGTTPPSGAPAAGAPEDQAGPRGAHAPHPGLPRLDARRAARRRRCGRALSRLGSAGVRAVLRRCGAIPRDGPPPRGLARDRGGERGAGDARRPGR